MIHDFAVASDAFTLRWFACDVARKESAFVIGAVAQVHFQSVMSVFGVFGWFSHDTPMGQSYINIPPILLHARRVHLRRFHRIETCLHS